MKKLTGLLILFFSFSTYLSAQVDVKSLEKYIEKSRQEWNVPGMAVAIVKDGKVVLSRGFGVKELGKKDKVDENTQFAIASNSKAFVASCIAKLVHEGELSWKDKVRKYLPYFTLYGDEAVSSMVTIEDLLCHRVGLGTFSGDVIWYKSDKTPEEIIKQAAHVPNAFEFRDGWGYSNLMFIAAGEVIRQVTGAPWEAYVKAHFIQPLGMENTVISIADLNENVATPHKPTLDRGTVPSVWASWDAPSAAGGIISSVNDLSKWLMMNLNGGVWEGQALIDKEQQNLLWTPHNNFKLSEQAKASLPGRHFSGYGLGWGTMDYHGTLLVGHGGGYDGMYSRVMMVPDLELGVVVLTNSMEGISTPLAYCIVNQFLEKDTRDWSAEYLERSRANTRHKDEVEERKAARKVDTMPAVTPAQMIGTYFDPMYGNIEISADSEGTLLVSFQSAPKLAAKLVHWHYDTYEIKWEEEHAWFDFGTLSFTLDNNLEVTGLAFDVPNGDIFFEELNPQKVAEEPK